MLGGAGHQPPPRHLRHDHELLTLHADPDPLADQLVGNRVDRIPHRLTTVDERGFRLVALRQQEALAHRHLLDRAGINGLPVDGDGVRLGIDVDLG